MVETKSKAPVAGDIQRKGFTKKVCDFVDVCAYEKERERKTRFFN